MLKPLVDAHNKALVANLKLLEPYNNHVHITARRKVMVITEWLTDRIVALDKERKAIDDTISKWRTDFDNAMKNLEGCGARKDAATTFVSNSNRLNQQWNTKYLNVLKAYYNELARLALYSSTNRSEYELLVESSKAKFLTALGDCLAHLKLDAFPQQHQGGDRQVHYQILIHSPASIKTKFTFRLLLP